MKIIKILAMAAIFEISPDFKIAMDAPGCNFGIHS